MRQRFSSGISSRPGLTRPDWQNHSPFPTGLLMPPHAGLAWLGALLIACYLADKATLRSLVWVGSMACAIGLFVVAARA